MEDALMHRLALAVLMPLFGWLAWRVGEKRRKRLKQKAALNRILRK